MRRKPHKSITEKDLAKYKILHLLGERECFYVRELIGAVQGRKIASSPNFILKQLRMLEKEGLVVSSVVKDGRFLKKVYRLTPTFRDWCGEKLGPELLFKYFGDGLDLTRWKEVAKIVGICRGVSGEEAEKVAEETYAVNVKYWMWLCHSLASEAVFRFFSLISCLKMIENLPDDHALSFIKWEVEEFADSCRDLFKAAIEAVLVNRFGDRFVDSEDYRKVIKEVIVEKGSVGSYDLRLEATRRMLNKIKAESQKDKEAETAERGEKLLLFVGNQKDKEVKTPSEKGTIVSHICQRCGYKTASSSDFLNHWRECSSKQK